MPMPEMEPRVSDATNQSVESSGSDIRHVLEEQRPGVGNFDAQIGGSENAPHTCAVDFDAGDTVGPIEDTKDAAEQPASVIMDKLDAQNGSIGEIMVSNGEELQMDTGSCNSARSWYLGYGLEMGDMVWGRVKSHPWWPGHIFNEAFASSSVRRTKKDGHVLVAFFGDGSYGWFDPAELIPYESHFVEKSQQSTSRNFVKAVQESVDEACRRSALGLTCFCRNPYNFRPTNVPRHMAVDVSDYDYEAGGIYSDNQIQKGRDNFQPERTLSFIEQLAAAPKKATTSLDFVRQKTTALAYRRAVFEEFDETYAQAFGPAHVRPIVAPPPSVDQSIKAQLCGPLVIAESLSGHKSSAKASKSKEQTKRDKYLLKQRDESGDTVSTRVGQGHSSSSSSAASEVRSSHEEAGDYVLQKRIQAVDQQDRVSTPAKDEVAASSGSPNKPYMVQDQSDPPTAKSKKSGVLKGGLKRSDPENSELREKKKKKKRATDSPGSSDHLQKHSSQTVAPSHVDSQPKRIISTSSASEQVPGPTMSTEGNESELKRVLADLKILALYPSHGKERNRPVIVRQIFLKFRSFVFQKSLTVPPQSTSNGTEANPAPPSRPPKHLGRTDDPSKGLKKRVPSERQEDLATKRAKKVSAMKSAAEKTKAGPETQQHPQRIGAKMQQPQKARVEEATFLVMKYPPGTSLPSSAELKARFARFGPMDTSQNRVFYTTNTCRIMFLYKEDAENAHKFALRNKSAFANVRFMLRPQSAPSDSQATTDNGQQSPAAQLKSCLKKASAGDGGGSQGARGARVRFNIGETTGSGGGSCSSSSSSSLCVANAMDSSSHKNEHQKVFSTHPSLQPPPPPFVSDPRNNVEAPSRSHSQNHNYVTKLPPPPPPPPRQAPPPPPPMVDISQQMMRLLTRCNDVVTNVKSVLGYVPYRPL